MTNEQMMLRRKIDAHSFSAWELHLFLDSHPNNCEAAKKYDECKATMAELTKEYEDKFGQLYENSSDTNRWQWVSSPWPWEIEVDD